MIKLVFFRREGGLLALEGAALFAGLHSGLQLRDFFGEYSLPAFTESASNVGACDLCC